MDQWHYALNGRPVGPVDWEQLLAMARSGELAPAQLVWREGTPSWVPAGAVGGLVLVPPGAEILPVAYATALTEPEERVAAFARQECIAMFVLFCLAASTVMGALATFFVPSGNSSRGFVWVAAFSCIALPSGMFAAMSLPMRWRALSQIPRSYRVLGLIGGFGLVVMLLVVLGAIGLAFLPL